MSDTQLRALERRWRETGAVEDEAAYLLERVRAGDLEPIKLEHAAYCGHEASLKALGQGLEELELAQWLAGVEERLGLQGLRRAGLASVEAALQVGESEWDKDVREIARSISMLVLCPCLAHQRRLELLQPLWGFRMPPGGELVVGLLSYPTRTACRFSCQAAFSRLEEAEGPVRAFQALCQEVGRALGPWIVRGVDPLTRGWSLKNARCSRAELIQLLAGEDSVWDVRDQALDPMLVQYVLEDGMEPEQAIDRALAFEPVQEDTPELSLARPDIPINTAFDPPEATDYDFYF